MAGVVPSHTAPAPRPSPKPDPEMAICAPAVAMVGFTLPIEGTGITVKLTALLVPALVVTVTFAAPVAALAAILSMAVI